MKNPNIIEFVDHPTVVLNSGLVLSPGLRPTRVVLRHLEDEGKFVTHLEFMRIDVETRIFYKNTLPEGSRPVYDVVVCRHEFFENGRYFEYDLPGRRPIHNRTREEAYEVARKDFEDRRKRVV